MYKIKQKLFIRHRKEIIDKYFNGVELSTKDFNKKVNLKCEEVFIGKLGIMLGCIGVILSIVGIILTIVL